MPSTKMALGKCLLNKEMTLRSTNLTQYFQSSLQHTSWAQEHFAALQEFTIQGKQMQGEMTRGLEFPKITHGGHWSRGWSTPHRKPALNVYWRYEALRWSTILKSKGGDNTKSSHHQAYKLSNIPWSWPTAWVLGFLLIFGGCKVAEEQRYPRLWTEKMLHLGKGSEFYRECFWLRMKRNTDQGLYVFFSWFSYLCLFSIINSGGSWCTHSSFSGSGFFPLNLSSWWHL